MRSLRRPRRWKNSTLLARIARGLGSGNLDHRLRRTDFRDEANDPLYPALGCAIAELEQVSGALVVGWNIRKEVPLLAHRLRKAALRGAKISFVNPQPYEYLFPVASYLASNGLDMFGHLVAIAAAASAASGKSAPESIAALVANAQPTDAHHSIAKRSATARGGSSCWARSRSAIRRSQTCVWLRARWPS